ncbi:MAG TPA: outer membrane beta-barrel protein [Mucilaginibacter sp.]
MKKILLALFVLGVTACSSFAQTKSSDVARFSIGVDPGIPVGDASNAYNFAIGGSLKYDIPISTGTFFNLSAGYTAFLTKSVLKQAGFKSSYGYIPLKAGIKYYFNGQGFYGEAQLGATFSTESGGGTAFAYAPGFGYTVDGGFDIGVRYEGWSHDGTVSQIALRISYNIQ